MKNRRKVLNEKEIKKRNCKENIMRSHKINCVKATMILSVFYFSAKRKFSNKIKLTK